MYSKEFPVRRRSNPNMAPARHRPKSMPDFASLLDTSYTPLAGVPENGRPRKKPSISLAAGLIMASETQSPKSMASSPTSQQHQQQQAYGKNEGWSDSLFYAYAQKSDYAQYPPYVLTFASAAVANQWWNLVKSEYPESSRMGPQLFILKGDDMQEQIQDNPRFHDLRNKWFYTPSDGGTGVIPLQDWKGNPITAAAPAPTAPTLQKEEMDKKMDSAFDMTALSATLDKMNAMISENSASIRALSVAQSEGLQRMQEINETSTTQIKALADGQTKLQSLMDQNATHYIALANSSFTAQEQVKSILQTNAEQIQSLANSQTKFATTCNGMMKTIEKLGSTVGKVGDSVGQLQQSQSMPGSYAGSASSLASSLGSVVGNRISPPPRKLNRKIKGVWYEYDDSSSPTFSPRKSVAFLDTPPKSPSSTRTA